MFQCVVIGLQSTGEARTLEQLEECGGELNDFVSTAKLVPYFLAFECFVKLCKIFPKVNYGGQYNCKWYIHFRGVLQTLVEKHFPAPDRKKTMDLFGWNSSVFSDSPVPSPKATKRKKGQSMWLLVLRKFCFASQNLFMCL